MGRASQRAVSAAIALTAALCSCAPDTGPQQDRPSVTPTATTSPGPDVLGSCPAARSLAALDVLARVGGDDDDVAVSPEGNVWISQPHAGRLVELDGAGHVLRALADPDIPEGIALLPDGRMLVAEQRTNVIDSVEPRSGARSLVASLPGAGGADVGVDGLGVDARGSRLLVPDSPAGTLLAIPLDGRPSTTLAAGLGRPVSAAVLADGSVLVATENDPGLVRVAAGSAASAVVPAGRLHSVDEVVVSRGGVAYVADLAAGAVDAVDPQTGRVRTLVSAAPSPQGLALLPDGRLLVTDSVRQIAAIAGACG